MTTLTPQQRHEAYVWIREYLRVTPDNDVPICILFNNYLDVRFPRVRRWVFTELQEQNTGKAYYNSYYINMWWPMTQSGNRSRIAALDRAIKKVEKELLKHKHMKMAKPTKKDFEAVLSFFNASEMALEREKFSFKSPEENWRDLDEDDEERGKIIALRKRMAFDNDMEEDEVSSESLMYEYLKRKFIAASSAWRRVYWAASVLMDNCCDPTEDCLAFYPGFELNHVEKEM